MEKWRKRPDRSLQGLGLSWEWGSEPKRLGSLTTQKLVENWEVESRAH